MGMFKNMKQGFDIVRSDELKELKKKADAQPKTNPLDGLRMANQAMDNAAAMQESMGMVGGANPGAAMGLMSNGIQGNGTVKSLNDTGQQVNGAPVYEVVLAVALPNQEPYDVTHKQIIALAAVSNWQPGAMFPVRVDPSNPQNLVIG